MAIVELEHGIDPRSRGWASLQKRGKDSNQVAHAVTSSNVDSGVVDILHQTIHHPNAELMDFMLENTFADEVTPE